MKKFIRSLFISTLVVSVVGVTSVFALDFGTQITVFDEWAKSGSTWWNTESEDQEVEWNCVATQPWDLEGFFLKGKSLTMVGGYDFKNGYENTYSGDIFIDLNDNMAYGQNVTELSGNGNQNLNNVFGYDYVIDLTLDPKTLGTTYNVYKIGQSATLQSVYYRQNDTSGAWRYVSGGGDPVSSGNLLYQSDLSDTDTGFFGGTHYALTVDLGFLTAGTDFTVQYTMGCGNDDLIGKGTISTPESGTLILLGGGLLGLFAIARKRVR